MTDTPQAAPNMAPHDPHPGVIHRWVTRVRTVLGITEPPLPDLPLHWEQMAPASLWTTLRQTARWSAPDPRATAVVQSGRPIPVLEMARWILQHHPEEAPRLCADLGYDLRLFADGASPELLRTTLAQIPRTWHPRPVEALASTPAWEHVAKRGPAWEHVLLHWAGATLSLDQEASPAEQRVIDAGLSTLLRLVVDVPRIPDGESEDSMQRLWDMVEQPTWRTWARQRRRAPIDVIRTYGEVEAWQFAPTVGWPKTVALHSTHRRPLLAHPLQALAHDRIWDTRHAARSYEWRGRQRWEEMTPRRDRDLVRRALLRWWSETGAMLAPSMPPEDFEILASPVSPQEMRPFLTSPDRATREFGLALMGKSLIDREARNPADRTH